MRLCDLCLYRRLLYLACEIDPKSYPHLFHEIIALALKCPTTTILEVILKAMIYAARGGVQIESPAWRNLCVLSRLHYLPSIRKSANEACIELNLKIFEASPVLNSYTQWLFPFPFTFLDHR